MKGKEFDTKNAPISFIDLEMTGLESAKHEIVEIGLVKVAQPSLDIIETWETKVRPEHLETADPESIKIAGYKDEDWKEAITLQEAMKILAEKVKGTIYAGFNVPAEYSFLDAAVTKTGIPLDFHKHVLDVNSFVFARLGYEWGEIGLNTLSKKLGINLEKHHTALPDAMACYKIYKKVSRETS